MIRATRVVLIVALGAVGACTLPGYRIVMGGDVVVGDASDATGDGSSCTTECTPRPVSPWNGANISNLHPTLRWRNAAGRMGSQLVLCGTHDCANPVTMDMTGDSGDPSANAMCQGSCTPSSPCCSGALVAGRTFFWRVQSVDGATINQSALWTFRVQIPTTRMAGTQAAWGGNFDFNGDGVSDLAVGLPGGADSASAMARAQVWQFNAGGRMWMRVALYPMGGATGDGSMVSVGGDIDGDGATELLLLAPQENMDSGTVRIFQGGTPFATEPSATLRPAAVGMVRFGASGTGVGDVDRDGYGDVLVGAPGSGNAYLYRGGPNGIDDTMPTVQTFSAAGGFGRFGAAVAAPGDVNGDGFADFLISAPGMEAACPGRSAHVLLYHGSAGMIGPPVELPPPGGPLPDCTFGAVVAGLGDVNGDGLPDYGVASPVANRVYVYFGALGAGAPGPAVVISDIPVTMPARFGFALTGGDIDHDGFSDVIVGAPGEGMVQGAIHLYRGSAAFTMTAPMAVVLNVPPNVAMGMPTRFGACVSAYADLDADGLTDWVAAAPDRDFIGNVPGNANFMMTAQPAQSSIFVLSPTPPLGRGFGASCASGF